MRILQLKKRLFVVAVCVIFICFTVHVAEAQTFDFSKIIFNNHTYHPDIASVKVGVRGITEDEIEMAKARSIGAEKLAFFPPVIHLNGDDKIVLTFDDLSSNMKYMRYTLIHCTYDWKPTTTLNVNEYLSRFTEGDVINYTHSRNTLQAYVSFEISFPNENIEISKSGNYLLYVYEDDGGKIIPLITRRIMVVENMVTITPNIQQSTNINERFTHQEITFQIDLNNQRLLNPTNTLKVLVMQNERYDNALLITTPYINQGNVLMYNQRGSITMEGGNEFRIFNTKSLRSNMEGVERIAYLSDNAHVYLFLEGDRQYKAYASYIDINGYYFNETIDFYTVDEADYARVHFRLQYDKPVNGSIYVFGELTNWQLMEEAKLKYMDMARSWQTDLYVKSGYYNYMYLFVPEGSNVATADLIEGNHWETENRYTFFVYYKPDPSSYDRIIAYTTKYAFPKIK